MFQPVKSRQSGESSKNVAQRNRITTLFDYGTFITSIKAKKTTPKQQQLYQVILNVTQVYEEHFRSR